MKNKLNILIAALVIAAPAFSLDRFGDTEFNGPNSAAPLY